MISHLHHTNVSAISKELSQQLAANGSLSSGRVLTLVVLAEKGHSREALNAAIRASHEHPSRIIVHIAHSETDPDQLDAEIHVGGTHYSARLGQCLQTDGGADLRAASAGRADCGVVAPLCAR